MRVRGEVTGDDLIDQDIEDAIAKIDKLPQTMDKGAEKLINRAKNIARLKGLHRTGAGLAGIIYERERNDRLIGWAPRPSLHLYFHEIGTYKDYPRPHVRPAADQTEKEIIEDIRKNVVGD